MTCSLGPISRLVDRAAALTGLPAASIVGPRKHRPLCRARWAVIRAARLRHGRSYQMIGLALGGRDHSTIVEGMRRAGALIEHDPAFEQLCDILIKSEGIKE